MNWRSNKNHKVKPPTRARLHLEVLEDRLVPAGLSIAQENLLAGAPQSQWGISGSGDLTIQGVGEGTQTISTVASPLAFRNAITTRPVARTS